MLLPFSRSGEFADACVQLLLKSSLVPRRQKKKCFSNTTFFIWCAAFGCTIFFASEENHLINQIVASMSETKFYMTALFRVNLSTRVIIYFINTCHCTEVIIQQFELFSARF